jgi:2-(1,2-epoxy-1,2-dihydrophenyl)acetyl-CoA isomerase
MTYQTILFDATQCVATLTLHRPHKLNSFTAEMHDELRAALKIAQDDKSIRALLLTGSGRGFCAGQDLSERRAAADAPPPDLGASLDKNFNPLIRAIRSLEIPVVCAVNGVAAGAGANLALACDIVLAARSASFIQSFSKIGLIPDCGGTFFLPRLVGSARAMALAMLAERVPAETAADWGMIWKCVDDMALQQEARALAEHLASQSSAALGLIKRAINNSALNSLDTQLDLERDLQRTAGRAGDYREGVAAFLEKRSAKFEGR